MLFEFYEVNFGITNIRGLMQILEFSKQKLWSTSPAEYYPICIKNYSHPTYPKVKFI